MVLIASVMVVVYSGRLKLAGGSIGNIILLDGKGDWGDCLWVGYGVNVVIIEVNSGRR